VIYENTSQQKIESSLTIKEKIKMAKDKLTKKESAVPVPDGFHHRFDLSDIKLPGIILWQSMTHIEELEGSPGELINNVTGENYGTQLTGYVADVWRTARQYGGKDDREIKRFSSDAECWDDDGSPISLESLRFRNGNPPEVSLLYHYLIIIEGEMLPAVVTFKGASIKNAKKFNALLAVTKPYWATAFTFISISSQNDKGRFFVLKAAIKKKRPSLTIAKMCSEFYHINRQSRVKSFETEPGLEEDKESDVPF